MCGICGIYNPAGANRAALDGMLHTIIHRGPDDEGVFIDGCVGLGSRRLSIIDLPGGKQPISNEDRSVWIVFNGEIYNYRQLRKELVLAGHEFQTNTDTEVIVHLYEELGERFVERLNGMFAIAIWDERQHKLVLARDRIGQKPLFYSQEAGGLLFASEVKAILAASQQAREIDFESIHHYLSLRFIPPPQTMLRHIKKLPPAHILVFQNGRLNISRYWDLSFQGKMEQAEAELFSRLQEKLTQTIESHLISDVPVGAFLSGGLDSSMIVAVMAKDLGQSFKTFSIGVKEQGFNELPHARAVAEHYHTEHIEQCVEADLIRSLPKMIWHLDEPSDPIASCFFQAAELASRHVKVVLGGDGGDELFAGFDRYLGVGYIDRYTLIPALIRQRLIGPVLSQISDNFGYKNLTQKMRWMHQLSLLPGTAERYAEATCFFRFNHQDKQSLFHQELWSQVGHLNSAEVIVEQYNRARADDPLDRMLYADFMTRLPEHSLMLTDRMTMAHSLEARSPYLDHELVELMAAFPYSMKVRNRTTKYVLRELARDYLPEQIVKRDKQGFMFPIAYWFRSELNNFLERYLLDSYFVKSGLFKKESVIRLIEEHRNNRVDHHVRLWMLLNLEIWHQMFIQQLDCEVVERKLMSYL